MLAVGPINADGAADLIVGCPIARGDPALNTTAIQQGAVFVFYASASQWPSGTSALDTQANVVYYGGSQVKSAWVVEGCVEE